MRTYEVIKKVNVSLPITVLEAKNQLNLEDDFLEDDLLITRYIKASERFCSGLIGRDIAETTVTHKISNFLGGTIRVKENPLMSITSVTHTDADGVDIVIPLKTSSVDGYTLYEDQFFFDVCLPTEYGGEDQKVTLIYKTGVVISEIPMDMISAIHIKVATLYDHERENYSDYKLKSNRSIENLLAQYMRML